MTDGFRDSTLRLNRFIREQESWNADVMGVRSHSLADKALSLWKTLEVEPGVVRQYELIDHRRQAAAFDWNRNGPCPMDVDHSRS